MNCTTSLIFVRLMTLCSGFKVMFGKFHIFSVVILTTPGFIGARKNPCPLI